MVIVTQTDLAERIRRLQVDRAKHVDAITQIDRLLGQVERLLGRPVRAAGAPAAGEQAPDKGALLGQALADLTLDGTGVSGTLGPAPAAMEPPRRRRGRFVKIAEDSVLDLIRARGSPSTADVNAHWRAEGRKGTANVTLFKLLRDGRIARVADPAVRGSRYVLAQPAPKSPERKAPPDPNASREPRHQPGTDAKAKPEPKTQPRSHSKSQPKSRRR